ncbi:MAG: ABC transporter permease [Lactococcus plantarum]|nr:ABC transporter permease [Lactococcus plantarum]
MFYFKLAIRNLKKSLGIFSPFLLATTVMFAMTFIISNISFSKGVDKLKGAQYAQFMMFAGLFIVIIFSVIIVSYSYRFLLKQRTKEFGLYNILGLNKRQISTISFWELLIALIITVITGAIIGIILSQFLFLVFVKIIGANYFNLGISPIAISLSVIVFTVIFCLLMGFALITIRRHSAISLLKDNSRSEKEPRGRVIISVLSLLLLGTAYFLALTIKNPLVAFFTFFIAALLVIIGTYLLYMGVTIFVLKRQKANKAYYYKPEHFITTSSMLYRMKTNAVGLANITILVTMTFVTVATSLALYIGVQDVVKDLFPKNTNIKTYTGSISENKNRLNAFIEENKLDNDELSTYSNFSVQTTFNSDAADHVTISPQKVPVNNMASLVFVTRDDMVKLGNTIPELKDNQLLMYPVLGKVNVKSMNWYGAELSIIKATSKLKNLPSNYAITTSIVFVVKDEQELINLNHLFNDKNKLEVPNGGVQNVKSPINTDTLLNISEKKQRDLITKDTDEVNVSTKLEVQELMNGLTGGFLFIGFILGITFILGAALIIYYKQISEGAEDKRSYRILQEIGLTKEEVKKTINSQVLVVFFMPIIISIIHFAAAFVMISKLIKLFGISNMSIIAYVSIATIVGISIIYFLIYRKTSKIYYRIVER